MISAQVTDAPVSLRDRNVLHIVIREISITKATAKTLTNVPSNGVNRDCELKKIKKIKKNK